MNSGNNNRKPVKSGVDVNQARRTRESQRLSVQKDKRFAQCALHRRKLEDVNEIPSKKPAEVEEFPHYCAVLMDRNSSLDDIRFSAVYFRYLLSSQQVAGAGLIPRFIELLQLDHPKIAYELLWSLTNIACEGLAYAECMMQHGITAHLLRYVKAPQYDVMEQCIWLISHLTIHTTSMVDALVSEGVILAVLEKLGIVEETCHIIPSFVLMQCVAWILANVVRLHASGDVTLYRNIIKALAIFLQAPDDDVIVSICVGITCVAEISMDLSRLLLEYAIPNRLHELFCTKTPDNKCYRHLVVALSSLVNSFNAWQLQVLVQYDAPRHMLRGAANLSPDANQQQTNVMILTSCKILARRLCYDSELDVMCTQSICAQSCHSSVMCVVAEFLCVIMPVIATDSNRYIMALRALRKSVSFPDAKCVLQVLQCIIAALQPLRQAPLSDFHEMLKQEFLNDECFLTEVDTLSCSSQLKELSEAAEIVVYLCNALSNGTDIN